MTYGPAGAQDIAASTAPAAPERTAFPSRCPPPKTNAYLIYSYVTSFLF